MAGSKASRANGAETASKLSNVASKLRAGVAIPAHPLALDANRRLDERRQRALTRYYLAAGAGGLAVGVHTTQFAIRRPEVGLLKPVWTLAAEEMDRGDTLNRPPLVRVAGICGATRQAVEEARLARDLGYHYGLVNLGALAGQSIDALVAHCRAVGDVLGLFGFYLQPSVGGIDLPIAFWQRFCALESAAAIKVAAFDRYRTLEVVRAVAESGRQDIALYTGNDDNIVCDLCTPFQFASESRTAPRRFVGGLLGQWAVWTSRATELLTWCRRADQADGASVASVLRRNAELTDANAAIFDAANGFKGCIAGIHEVLRRQGLLTGTWCLDSHETLSPGQAAELDRVLAAYPHLTDDSFVAANRDDWLSG